MPADQGFDLTVGHPCGDVAGHVPNVGAAIDDGGGDLATKKSAMLIEFGDGQFGAAQARRPEDPRRTTLRYEQAEIHAWVRHRTLSLRRVGRRLRPMISARYDRGVNRSCEVTHAENRFDPAGT